MFVSQNQGGQLPSMLTKYPERIEHLAAISKLPFDTPLKEILEKLKIEYITADLSQPQTALGLFDLVTSNNTFEHIYPQVLEPILRNLHDLHRAGGIQSHFIDLSDHYAHMDSSINIYNFLRYSDTAWRFIDNSVQPMNRWRMPNYRQLYNKVGATILAEDHRAGDVAALRTVPLADRFKAYADAENAISHGYIVSVRKA
jgi:cyclopropane fatty-acyl-phospholipid synthase-like methyltransferase